MEPLGTSESLSTFPTSGPPLASAAQYRSKLPWTFQWSSSPVWKVQMNFSDVSFVSQSVPVTVISGRHPCRGCGTFMSLITVSLLRWRVSCAPSQLSADWPQQPAGPDGPALWPPVHTLALSPGRQDDLLASSGVSRWPGHACVCSSLVLGGEPAAGAQCRGKSARSWLPGACLPLGLITSSRPSPNKTGRVSDSTAGCFAAVLTAVAMPPARLLMSGLTLPCFAALLLVLRTEPCASAVLRVTHSLPHVPGAALLPGDKG